ncbi:hypothetical protein [Endozoicomonas lisbonensis]
MPGEKNSQVSTYKDMIKKAIESAPGQKMLLNEIYQWFQNEQPAYIAKKGDWKNSIRHNLSLHSQFVKTGFNKSAKSNYWGINSSKSKQDKKSSKQRKRQKSGASASSTTLTSTSSTVRVNQLPAKDRVETPVSTTHWEPRLNLSTNIGFSQSHFHTPSKILPEYCSTAIDRSDSMTSEYSLPGTSSLKPNSPLLQSWPVNNRLQTPPSIEISEDSSPASADFGLHQEATLTGKNPDNTEVPVDKLEPSLVSPPFQRFTPDVISWLLDPDSTDRPYVGWQSPQMNNPTSNTTHGWTTHTGDTPYYLAPLDGFSPEPYGYFRPTDNPYGGSSTYSSELSAKPKGAGGSSGND